MNKGYSIIADGLKLMAAGYEMLAGMERTENAKAPVEETLSEPVKKAAKKAEKPKEEPPVEKKVDVKDVRAVMRQKIKDGKMEECQEALHSFGCGKLTDVPEERLAELLAKVEVL